MDSIRVEEISRSDIKILEMAAASITDVRHLSSYNWIDASVPTIAVPGTPPLWTPPKPPQKVPKDSGHIYIAQNAARYPECPLEPLFRALYISNPSFDICSIDLVTDRNNIRKLLAFVNPYLTEHRLEPFTINVEVANNTAIFCRAETETQRFIGPHEFVGFGHEFEKTYTTSQVDGSTGHHRVISYRFSGLKFLLRYETDGYIDIPPKAQAQNKDAESDTLSSMIESLSLHSANSLPHAASTKSKLRVNEEGQGVPIESTLEIKTRVFHKPIAIQEVLPQLWVSQTPNLVRAYHRNGLFQPPKVENVTLEIRRWENEHQEDLKMLAALIRRIINAAKRCGGNAIVKYGYQGDKLMVRKTESRKLLPDDLYSKLNPKSSLITKHKKNLDPAVGSEFRKTT
ncbi:hypothetical protein ETB97_011490 [Aspergillus alliaceus]|uniref:Geranylgeranyl pyrophosphate synthetase n=1 Tax=Petromyces alliaceus TaxID=209559 RepID=A0A8H6A691_PETAA|nr:hypothetical protein ETB97_011490 [Aspergillus burnettii]